jgi:hypothetical protein
VKTLGVTKNYAYVLLNKARKELGILKTREGTWKYKARMQGSIENPQIVAVATSSTPVADNVNHPAHYKTGGIETIDFIEAKKLNYNLGNVVKYVTRADHKGNRKEDLQKARWYLYREIEKLSS